MNDYGYIPEKSEHTANDPVKEAQVISNSFSTVPKTLIQQTLKLGKRIIRETESDKQPKLNEKLNSLHIGDIYENYVFDVYPTPSPDDPKDL